MKKILFVLTVFLLAAPAMAVVTIDAVQSATDPCDVYITYVSTEDSNVRAFALDIWVDDGNILAIEDYNVGECNDFVQGYGIFMGTIQINTSGVVTDDGTPVADYNDLPSDSLHGPDSNGVTIEMGSLYVMDVNSGPKKTGTLFRIRISGKVPCNMTIKTNVSRGGIVLENGDSSEDETPSFTTNLPQTAAIPACLWCPSDISKDDKLTTTDFFMLRGRLSNAKAVSGDYEILPNDPCAAVAVLWAPCGDISGDNKLTTTDFFMLRGRLSNAKAISGDYEILPDDPCDDVRALWPCP